ncbi:MAG: hypothetical protein E7410_00850 [Ruminococcaceae bacterium]|nr:hypothetical protein [Oscillospiraceae bacterium]
MGYYDYDKNDVAKSIQQAMDDYASPEVVKYLLNERNKKIDSDLQYEKYRNDNVTKSAQEYIDRYSGAFGKDIDALYQAKSDAAAQRLAEASEKNLQTYNAGALANNQAYDDARKGVYSAYRRSAFGNEEMLAANGLGRGISNAPSSGYGETSRMAQNMAYQNDVYNLYKGQNDAQNALVSEYMKGEREALGEYNAALTKLADERIEQAKEQREYRRELDKDRIAEAQLVSKSRTQDYSNALDAFKATGVVQNEEQSQILGIPVGMTTAQYKLDMLEFETKEEQRAFENAITQQKLLNEQQSDLFERAYELFKSAGSVVSEQMAQILGIPVGTKYWQYVIASKNAASSASNAAASYLTAQTNADIKQLDYEIDKQNADTKKYEAETARMKLMGEY